MQNFSLILRSSTRSKSDVLATKVVAVGMNINNHQRDASGRSAATYLPPSTFHPINHLTTRTSSSHPPSQATSIKARRETSDPTWRTILFIPSPAIRRRPIRRDVVRTNCVWGRHGRKRVTAQVRIPQAHTYTYTIGNLPTWTSIGYRRIFPA